MSDAKYFMVPISILSNLNSFADIQDTAHLIIKLGVYRKSLTLEHGNEVERLIDAAEFFGINFARPEGVLKEIRHRAFTIEDGKVLTSLNRDVVWDFYENKKTDHEVNCFRAYAALKSIIGPKTYAKVTNDYLIARFFGCAATSDVSPVFKESALYQKYARRKALTKIKETLSRDWNLSIYGHHTRGFYVSFKLDFAELAYQVERTRKSIINKEVQSHKMKIIDQIKARVQAELNY